MLGWLALLFLPFLLAAQTAEIPDPTIQAILFYSPTCPHCHQVINELLIPMQEEYGDQLQIMGIDTAHPAGSELYGRAIEHFEIPENRRGVPTLIINDTVMVGGQEIPEKFPGMVEEGLAAGGIGWPDIPDLALIIPDLPPSADAGSGESVAAQAEVSEPDPLPTANPTADAKLETESEEPAVATVVAPQPAPAQSLEDADREISSSEPAADPPADPAGFTLAWIVLLGMIVALLYAIRQIFIARPLLSENTLQTASSRLVPLLALLGLGVASYLAYVELTHVEAVCGPVGECNIVQSSPYAQLFGVPIATWGLLNYLAILTLWTGQKFLSGKTAAWCSLGLVLLVVFGTMFSIYLTLLELFAIEAICLWCLSSAVITTLIMILVTKNIGEESLQVNLAAQTKS